MEMECFAAKRGLAYPGWPGVAGATLLASNLLSWTVEMNNSMNFDDTMQAVRACAQQMDALYGETVFDEWVLVSLRPPQARVLNYFGPRHFEFRQKFASDLGTLRAALLQGKHQPGDFEFARNASGTCFEGFMALGDDVYLICNNTRSSMDQIARNPRWLHAQVPFAELSERICAQAGVCA
jgi:hypothetical protein